MKAGKKFWFMWENESRSILIIQVFYYIKFKKIFKDPKMENFKRDKIWLGTMQLMDDDTLEEGFCSLYQTNDLKGGILNISGTIMMQIFYEEISLFIPIDENMIIGELQILTAKYINLQPNKFIITGFDKKNNIFRVSVVDNILKLIKRGVEHLQVHDHNYDIDFFSYRKLSIPMKKLQFYNQKFEAINF
jgi:hypothetical protein